MRFSRSALVALTFSCLHATIAARQPWLVRRDDSPASTASQSAVTSQAASSLAPTTTQSSQASSSDGSSIQQSSVASHTSNEAASSSSVVQVSATASATGSSATATATSTSVLPIQPTLTPAMGLTGAILLLSGIAYSVIGIKNKWLYVFFSAAYLTSLAVSVLIVYLMSPPVSNAVQGAFFVAAFLSGLIFGVLALVFPDITDGLGCLLGGFCLSMWFLTLKAGGLISSTTGRAVFIGVMSFAGFSLSFSHYTRTYGLIVSISFAGATITVLGIDCFSSAGWKEFWLYIWNLNSNTFPLNTNTYPMTRGIKVEVACVVIITALGLVSQFKLWKVVKERREKTAALRSERERNIQQEEEELGRRIEDEFTRERAQWENTYGDKSMQQESTIDSSTISVQKSSVSIKEKGVLDSMEMTDMNPQKTNGLSRNGSKFSDRQAPHGPTVTVTVMHEDDIQEIDEHGDPVSSSLLSRQSATPSNPIQSKRNSTEQSTPAGGSRSVSARDSLRASVPPPPVVIPLPFTIPKEEDGRSEADNASVSAVPESVRSASPARRPSKRLSGGNLLKRLSGHRLSAHRLSTEHSDSDEALIVPHIEDDRASSVAATLDDDYDALSLPDLTPPHSPVVAEHSQSSAADGPDGLHGEASGQQNRLSKSPDRLGDSKIDTGNRPAEKSMNVYTISGVTGSPTKSTGLSQSLTSSTDPKSHDMLPALETSTKQSAADPDTKQDAQGPVTVSPKSRTPSQSSMTASPVEGLGRALPNKLSKVALSYRTNEWAKHLESAEHPDLDNISEPGSPGIKVTHEIEDAAAPIRKDTRESQVVTVPKKKRASTESYMRPAMARSSSDMAAKYANAEALKALSRSPSGLERTSPIIPTTAFPAQTRAVRSSSSPYFSPGQSMSPSPEPLPSKISPVPSSAAKNTLMSQREALVRNKVSSHSFTPTPNSSSPNLTPGSEAEDVPLAQRKQMMQKQRPVTASQQWRQSGWAGAGNQPQIYDSHQPRRSSAGYDQDKREVMLANWRESVRHDGAPVQTAPVDEQTRRAAMISARRQKEMHKQQQAVAAQYRDSMMNSMMRSGEMQDAHRDALRRMQAKANKNAK